MIIAFSTEKGGVGKSTAAISTAMEWHRRKLRVLLVDLDPQRTVMDWRSTAENLGYSAPSCIAKKDSFYKTLSRVAKEYDRIILDTSGHRDGVLTQCLNVADFVVMPVRASPPDIWSAYDTFGKAWKMQVLRPSTKIKILLSCVDARTNYSREARQKYAASGFSVLNTQFHQRIDYATSIGAGQGPTTYAPGSKAAKEVKQLCRELDLLFKALKKG